MGTFSIWHWLVVVLVVVLLFGGKKLRNLGGDLAATVQGFRRGMKSGSDDSAKKEGIEENAQNAQATEPEKSAQETRSTESQK